jgi:hypothetical protein
MITEQGATWPSTTRPRAAGQNWPDTLAALAKKMGIMFFQAIIAGLVLSMGAHPSAQGQMPPSQAELSAYVGLHKAAADGNLDEIRTLLLATPDPNLRDRAGRTPLHVAVLSPAMTPFVRLLPAEVTSTPLRMIGMMSSPLRPSKMMFAW